MVSELHKLCLSHYSTTHGTELEYSRADYDQNHILNFSAVYELPIGRGRRFGSGMNYFADAIVGGWQISPIVRFSTGAPITLTDSARYVQPCWSCRSSNSANKSERRPNQKLDWRTRSGEQRLVY